MMPVAWMLLFFTVEGVNPHKVCSYQDVLDYLNLTSGNDVYTSTRPVLDYTHRTVVKIDVTLYAILAVIEKTQIFIPAIWVFMIWNNERISWDPAQFCGITKLSLPKNLLWQPDLFIFEMTEKDDAPHNPYVYVTHDGFVHVEDEMRLVSTCKMDIHKFPFDTQSCNITISSGIHTVNEVQLMPFSNSTRATQFSREIMQTQGEWEFVSLTVSKDTFILERGDWEQLIYTITMKRRPLLHIINYLLPNLFFLCLDLASFLISDHRGEKLGFKITVLLAISVLLLILNDILPSMSNRTPLIATYCIVIFALMLLSLLETILLTYLMEKDCHPKGNEADGCLTEDSKSKNNVANEAQDRWTHCAGIVDVPGGDTQCELLPVSEQVNSQQRSESHMLLLILEELREVKNYFSIFLHSKEERLPDGYWTRVAKRINKAFFIFYIMLVSVFLTLMYIGWSS